MLLALCLTNMAKVESQNYFYHEYPNNIPIFYKVNINFICSEICLPTHLGPTTLANFNSYAISNDGKLYLLNGGDIFEVDTLNGATTLFTDLPGDESAYRSGLVWTLGNYLLLSHHHFGFGDTLMQFDLNNDQFNVIGKLTYPVIGDMTLMNGIVYYPSCINYNILERGIAKFDPADPLNGEWVVTLPNSYGFVAGLTTSKWCNTLVATDELDNDELKYINIVDGLVTPLCENIQDVEAITSVQEHIFTDCTPFLDLDCNNSSGASDSDYNSWDYHCYSTGSPVADDDIRIFYDAQILEMLIAVSGNIPDGDLEVLELNGAINNLLVDGEGTGQLILTNDGNASSTDFINALERIVYNNLRPNPTPGLRTVEVQFTTESGALSNVATAFIEVIELPAIEVDLGDDLEICVGRDSDL